MYMVLLVFAVVGDPVHTGILEPVLPVCPSPGFKQPAKYLKLTSFVQLNEFVVLLICQILTLMRSRVSRLGKKGNRPQFPDLLDL